LSSNSDHESPVATEQIFTFGDRATPVDVGTIVGTVGYKFRKKFMDESGENIGLYDGEVVDIISGTEKDRKCLYAVDGYVENLSVAELVELKKDLASEHESYTTLQLGSVGWKFQKQFPDKKWYRGVVINILKDVENGKDRRCHYPIDDDFEDLSLADLITLRRLEKKKGKEEEDATKVKHNDLCETCGKVGELLCCSTCNLVFHLSCTRPKLTEMPADDWSCAFCITSLDLAKNHSKQVQQKARLAVCEIEAIKEQVRKEEPGRRSTRKWINQQKEKL